MNFCDAIDRPQPTPLGRPERHEEQQRFPTTSCLPLQSNIYATSDFRDKCHIPYPSGDIECFLRNVWSVIHFRATRRLQKYVSTLTSMCIKKKKNRSCRKNLWLHFPLNITTSTQKSIGFRSMNLWLHSLFTGLFTHWLLHQYAFLLH